MHPQLSPSFLEKLKVFKAYFLSRPQLEDAHHPLSASSFAFSSIVNRETQLEFLGLLLSQ
jgi:hypothetical protein